MLHYTHHMNANNPCIILCELSQAMSQICQLGFCTCAKWIPAEHEVGAKCVYRCYHSSYCNTVKPVYNGHCISRSPLYNSQVTESQMGLQCAFQPALTGYLSITASFLGPKGDHYRQVLLYQPVQQSSAPTDSNRVFSSTIRVHVL